MSNKKLYVRASFLAVAPFVLGCVLAILVAAAFFATLDKKAVFLLQKWLVAAFLLNSAIILLGTFEWAWSEFQKEGLSTKLFRKPIVGLGIIAILLCGGEVALWYVFISTNCEPAQCRLSFENRLHDSEVMSLVIFAVFLVIDVLGYVGLRHVTETHSENYHERDFYKRSIWIVDIPVIMIVIIVLLLRQHIFNEPGQITLYGVELLKQSSSVMLMDQPPLNTYGEMIGNGFAAGAMLAHILLAQLAFTFLKWEYYVRVGRQTAMSMSFNDRSAVPFVNLPDN